MSTFEIKMPKLGESITEGTIMSWSVKVGDVINEDDILFEVSTAKVSAEIPSPVAGKILEILFKEGDTVPVGTVVAMVQLEGEATEDDSPSNAISESPKDNNIPSSQSEEKIESAPVTPVVETKITKGDEERWYSPIVLQIAQEAKLSKEELDHISGTGYLGRLSKKDIKDYVDQKKKGVTSPASKTEPKATVEKPTAEVKASAAAPEIPKAASTESVARTPFATAEGDEIKEMDFIRRIIADRMTESKKISPHVTTVVEVDVTNLVNWRSRTKDAFLHHEGVSLTYMPAIVEATAKALIDFPQVNASVDGYRMILKKHINVGLAVSLNDGNLIVPVIHNADKLSLSGLAIAIDSLATKARSNKLSADDIQGGTFTITNFGSFKNIFGTPIINQPEVAILGVGYIEKKPAVISTPQGDAIAIRHKMYLSLSYDHRIVDGSLGGNFLRRIADYLENWKD